MALVPGRGRLLCGNRVLKEGCCGSLAGCGSDGSLWVGAELAEKRSARETELAWTCTGCSCGAGTESDCACCATVVVGEWWDVMLVDSGASFDVADELVGCGGGGWREGLVGDGGAGAGVSVRGLSSVAVVSVSLPLPHCWPGFIGASSMLLSWSCGVGCEGWLQLGSWLLCLSEARGHVSMFEGMWMGLSAVGAIAMAGLGDPGACAVEAVVSLLSQVFTSWCGPSTPREGLGEA